MYVVKHSIHDIIDMILGARFLDSLEESEFRIAAESACGSRSAISIYSPFHAFWASLIGTGGEFGFTITADDKAVDNVDSESVGGIIGNGAKGKVGVADESVETPPKLVDENCGRPDMEAAGGMEPIPACRACHNYRCMYIFMVAAQGVGGGYLQ